MGNKASKMNERYGNYEKSFERLEKDTQRVKDQLVVRGRRRSHISFWSSLLIAGAVAVAAAVIYQIQQQPAGTFTYQQHFQRTAAAACVPAVAVLLHWLAALWLDLQQKRDTRKLQRLEATQKTMLKELKEMINYDKVKALIDKHDPEARATHAAILQQGQAMGRHMAGPQGRGGPQHARGGGGGPQGQMPAMLVKGSGQVAGAAALAVAGAGKALMPLVDKLAATLISDNPVLLEDLRQAQSQMQVAQERAMGAVQESLGLKYENLDLKLRLVELESQLKVEPSYDLEGLEEQKQQLYQQTQQAAWQQEIQQQYLQQPPLDGGVLGGQQVMTQGSGSGNFGARASDAVQGLPNSSSSGELRQRDGGSKASLSSAGQLQGSTPPGTPKSDKL